MIVCRPSRFPVRRRKKCPTCAKVTRFAGYAYIWYDTDWTCLACGDSWGGGEMHARPFRRGWRAKAQARAAEIWADAGKYSKAQLQEWVGAELGRGR